ncbi:MAG: 4Fe-4S cluster-binding domain-containing protein [Bacilli bacterium]|nr:4Fe-4S cluster-binding domain-containing protein [Bacilli bacterium]
MRYAGIIKNDVAAGQGVCVTFFVQGCDQHCPGCHNPQTWDFNGGYEFT